MSRISIGCFVLLAAVIGTPMSVLACDACGCAFNASGSDETRRAGSMIITPTANTLGQGRGSVGVMFEHQRYNTIPAEDAHALHEASRDIHGKNHEEFYNVSLGYGVRDDVDLFLVVPVVSRTSTQIHDMDAMGRGERASGFSDLKLIGKYRFWKRGADAALLLGLKAPTGETSKSDRSHEKFEPEQQPGSGSWDFTSGLAVSRRIGEHLSLANAFQCIYRGEGAQDRKFGDVYRYDVGVSYALKPLGQHPNLSLVFELHNQWVRQDHSRDSAKVFDSGGTTTLISPGLSAEMSNGLSAFFAMPIPIHQNMGGEHEELTYEVLTGLAWHF